MIQKNRIIKIPRNRNNFLFGVRGSGKTSLLKRLFPSALYIDLLDASIYTSYLSDIGQFYETVTAFRNDGLVIVDEIQKMPQLLDEVHRLIESSNRKFILISSSACKMKASKGVNFLGGRAGKIHFQPFVPEELGEDFDLNEALRYGLLPVVWSSTDRRNKLKAYTEAYLTEEIKAEAVVKDLSAFARFLKAVSLYHGQILNMTGVASDSINKIHHMQNFFSILEDTMVGFFLPAYQAKLRVKEQKKPKFYLIDPGITRALKGNFGPVSVEERGSLFEGLIAQLLRAYKDYTDLYDKMYYWSSLEAKQTEVDFLLKRGKDLIAIEVKAKEQVSAQDYRGLKAIKELSDVKRRIIVYLGKDIRKTKQGIEIWPFDFFCRNLKEDFQSEVSYQQKKSKPLSLINLTMPLKSKELLNISSSNEKNLESFKRLDWGNDEDKE